MTEMKLKGSGLVALTKFVEERFGDEEYEAWLEPMSETQQTGLRSSFASSWYDYHTLYLEPLRMMCERFFSADVFEGARALGKYTAEKQLTGIYRALLKLGSPNLMIAAAGKTWRMLHSDGDLVTLENDPRSALIRTKGMPQFNPLIAEVTAAWMQKALEMAGGRDGHVSAAEKKDEDGRYFEFRIGWR